MGIPSQPVGAHRPSPGLSPTSQAKEAAAAAPAPSTPGDVHVRGGGPSPFRGSRPPAGRTLPGRAPAAPPSDSAARRRVLSQVREALDDSGFFGRVSSDEAETAAKAIAGLGDADASAVIRTLQNEGRLDKLTRKLDDSARDRFAGAMAQSLDGSALAKLGQSMRRAGEPSRAAFADALRSAPEKSRLAFVWASATATNDGTPTRSSTDPGFGSSISTRFKKDGDAVTVAAVISSLRGGKAHAAFSTLAPEQQKAVFEAAANPREVSLTAVAGPGIASTSTSKRADAVGFRALVDAAASIPDAAARNEALGSSLAALKGAEADLPKRARAEMAEAVLRHIDGTTLGQLAPDGVAALAGALAEHPAGPLGALEQVGALPASPQRDALIRTMFLKTPPGALEKSGGLRARFADALATGPEGTDAQGAIALRAALATESGRALLMSPSVSGAARLWAAQEVMKGSAAATKALASDTPWESPAVLKAHARGKVFQHEARGDRAVPVAGQNIENLIGAGLGAPLRADFPTDAEAAAGAQRKALAGQYNFYEGVEAVTKVATGIREAQRQMGKGAIGVATVPVQYSSEKTGPVDLKLYRVEGQNGQSRFVDNVGRVYASFEAWKKSNDLPPGKMTFPADGRLGAPGETALVTENTPDTSDTFWEHVGDVADVAALAGGVIASGVILVGSGGTATPLVAGAWAVALGSAGYMGIKAGADLYDRHAHGQTLALTDPDARAAWLSLAGAGLTVAGAGAMRGATALASQGAKLAPQAARAAGILNATANLADAASTVDQAHALVTNWDRMTPAQRAQMGLSIAFWGTMTGVSAKASGGKVTDAFSFRAQMNSALIESGAAVRPSPDMASGHVRVKTGYDDGGRLNLGVEYGPGSSKTSIRIHQDVARQLIDNSGAQGLIRRMLTDAPSFPPGSRGEEVALEVVKHRALVRAYEAEAPNAPERKFYETELRRYEGELDRLKANPSAARAPGRGHIDAASAEEVTNAVKALGGSETQAKKLLDAVGAPDAKHLLDAARDGTSPAEARALLDKLTAVPDTVLATAATLGSGPLKATFASSASDAAKLIQELGPARLTGAAESVGAEGLTALVDRVGTQTAAKLVDAGLAKLKHLTKLGDIASRLVAAGPALDAARPLGPNAIMLDSNAVLAIEKLQKHGWPALQDGEKGFINKVREQVGLPKLTGQPASTTTADLFGPADLRFTPMSAGEAPLIPGITIAKPGADRSSSAYTDLLADWATPPAVGGGKGVADRSIVADALFAAVDGGAPRTFVTGDANIAKALVERYAPAALKAKKHPNENFAATLAREAPGGFDMTVDGHTLRVVYAPE